MAEDEFAGRICVKGCCGMQRKGVERLHIDGDAPMNYAHRPFVLVYAIYLQLMAWGGVADIGQGQAHFCWETSRWKEALGQKWHNPTGGRALAEICQGLQHCCTPILVGRKKAKSLKNHF